MKNRNSKKFGFSLLGKPLRSGLNSLLCRWHSKARNPRIPSSACAHSFGFSLAEGMVMLVVVSILMAVSAPLIAKRSVADSKRIFGMRNNVITGAMGNQQKFLLGKNNPTNQDAKLDVNGLVMANEYGTNGDTLEISDRNNTILFSVDNDGNTNLPVGIPDFGNGNNTEGYLLVEDISAGRNGDDGHNNINACRGYITITGNGHTYMPSAYINTIVPDGEGTKEVTACVHMPALIPVSSGATVNLSDGSTPDIIPLTKAKADKTKKRKSNSSNSNQQTGDNNQSGNSSTNTGSGSASGQ